MRNFWSQIPMLRIALALIAGISLEIGFDYLYLSQLALLPASVLLGVSFITVVSISLLQNITWVYKLRVVNGIALSFFVITFGYTLTWFFVDKNYKTHFQKYVGNETFVVARIIKPPLEKAKIVTVVAIVEEAKGKNTTTITTGSILINVLRDSISKDLNYGDVIVFNSNIEEFDEPKNPEEFSFKLYQSFHNIYHRTFLKTGDWKLVATNHGNVLMAKVYRIREYFLSIILKYVTDKNDLAVAAAIMLGYNDYMNGDITRAYASSGALHVLSVSGLHVGIIFLMLNFLFSFIDKMGRRYQIGKAIGIIVFIWFYACLTGLSPSVLRSAMMFSMLQFGKVMIRNVNTYNIIFASALLLMLFNPFIITEVGFKLSYLAVIGIIYIQPKISALWVIGVPKQPEFKRYKWFLKPFYFLRYDLYWGWLKIVDLGWQIIAVSIAAQIATCPLSLLYFHQFPNLFLLSNLIVIPLSNLILFIGTALCALGEVAWLNDEIGWCFSHLLWLLNKFIFWIDSIPFALVQGISIAMFEMALLYIMIFLLCWLTEVRITKILIASLFIVFGLCSFYSYERILKAQQKKFVVYCASKQSAIAFIDGKKVLMAFDEKLLHDQSAMLFHVKHHWWDCAVNNEEKVSYQQLAVGKLILFEGKNILVVDSALEKVDFVLDKKLKVDFLVLSHSPKVYLQNLCKLIEFDKVVFDSSNKKWRIDFWKKDCAKMKVNYWDVSDKGAYIKDLNDDAFAQL